MEAAKCLGIAHAIRHTIRHIHYIAYHRCEIYLAYKMKVNVKKKKKMPENNDYC